MSAVLALLAVVAQAPAGAAPAGAAAGGTDHRLVEASPRPLSPLATAALRAAFAADPPIEKLRRAATALVLAEPARAHSLVTRARWSAFLPETRVRVDRRLGRAESVDFGRTPLDNAATPVGVDTTNDVRYEWRASWDLARIVFNPDEIGAEAQALHMADVRREIESLVIRLYFERRRLKAEALASDANNMASHLRLELRVQEIEAELDALTGDAFSRLRASRDEDTGFPAP